MIPLKSRSIVIKATVFFLTTATLQASAQTSNYFFKTSNTDAKSYREVIPLSDVGAPNTPKFTEKQSAWIRKIKRSTYWRQRRRHLFFSWPEVIDVDPPVIVFYAETRQILSNGEPDPNGGFFVVGIGCDYPFLRDRMRDAIIVPSVDTKSCLPPCYYDPLYPQKCEPAAPVAPKD